MADQWASSVDLHVDLRQGTPPAAALADAVRAAVRSGRLAIGAPLPSTRALAADLGVARGTVTSVYSRLAAEGYLTISQGAPTKVAEFSCPPGQARSAPEPEPYTFGARWNFMPGLPDVAAFPRQHWIAATKSVVTNLPASDLGFPAPGGHHVLREALAGYLGRARGVIADPDRIVVCAGFAHGLAVLAGVLRSRGIDSLAVENPSMPAFHDVVRAAGLPMTPVAVDESGLRVSEVDSPAVMITAAHQFPLGMPLDARRRMKLAGRDDTVIIEDDYDGEFRYDGRQIGAVQPLAPERIVYAGTTSKTLTPALRLGWLVLPRWLVEPMREALHAGGRAAGVLDQLVLAEMITSGRYDQHVRRCRSAYRRRRDRVLSAVADLPFTPQGIPAGLHLLLELPGGVSEVDCQAALRKRSVVAGALGTHWFTDGPHPQGVVVGFGAPAQHAFTPGLNALVSALRSIAE
jgi:GntR family transcriptional regulator/MocR family aminotransferase